MKYFTFCDRLIIICRPNGQAYLAKGGPKPGCHFMEVDQDLFDRLQQAADQQSWSCRLTPYSWLTERLPPAEQMIARCYYAGYPADN